MLPQIAESRGMLIMTSNQAKCYKKPSSLKNYHRDTKFTEVIELLCVFSGEPFYWSQIQIKLNYFSGISNIVRSTPTLPVVLSKR